MKVIKRQMKIKNFPDYVFDDNMIVDIKNFDSSQLEITNYHSRVFLVLII